MNESWINKVLKDSQYNLLIFKDEEIKALEKTGVQSFGEF